MQGSPGMSTAKGEPKGSCGGQEGWEDARVCAARWGAEGGLPGIPRNTSRGQGLWDQLLENSNLLLRPGDFCPVFSELLFQADQEGSGFLRNPLAPVGRL